MRISVKNARNYRDEHLNERFHFSVSTNAMLSSKFFCFCFRGSKFSCSGLRRKQKTSQAINCQLTITKLLCLRRSFHGSAPIADKQSDTETRLSDKKSVGLYILNHARVRTSCVLQSPSTDLAAFTVITSQSNLHSPC